MPGMTFGSFVLMAKQRFKSYDSVDTSFAGKTVLITGANTGLGLEAAHIIASLKPERLILAVRDIAKGNTAAAEIEAKANKPNLCHVLKLDMASFDSVINFASELEQEVPLLDTVILNAGVRAKDYGTTADGWETDLQVNALSTTLLTLLLLPHLGKTSEYRSAEAGFPVSTNLTLVTSSNHATVERNELPNTSHPILETLSAAPPNKKSFDAQLQYAKSKLAIMWFIPRLAELGQGPDPSNPSVVVSSVCPGACRTTMARGMDSLPEKIFVALFKALFSKPAKVGGEIIVKGSTLGTEGVGAYWYDNRIYQ